MRNATELRAHVLRSAERAVFVESRCNETLVANLAKSSAPIHTTRSSLHEQNCASIDIFWPGIMDLGNREQAAARRMWQALTLRGQSSELPGRASVSSMPKKTGEGNHESTGALRC